MGQSAYRQRAIRALLAAIFLVSLLAGCSGGESADSTTTTVAVPASCDTVTDLVPVAAIQAIGDHPCFEWMDDASGRAVQASTGSASVWSRRTETGTALIAGAIHTLGQGWYGPADTAVSEAVTDPEEYTGVPRLFLASAEGAGPDSLASPWFALYNPAIAAERNNNLMQDVLPREDFYVAVADGQKLDVSGLAQVPEPVTSGLVPLYDPAGVTLAAETWAEATAGHLVLLLGYPNETGSLTAAVGRILDEDAADLAIEALAAVGDAEGAIEYEPDVEMIIEGTAVAGMSGGPVVDRNGRLIGVMVRATGIPEGPSYVRAVRMSWIVKELADAVAAAPEELQAAIAPYLER